MNNISKTVQHEHGSTKGKPASPETDVGPNRILQLDGVRGIAILLVLVWHYLAIIPATANHTLLIWLKRLFSLAWSGVDLFFVLSGFLIGRILMTHRRSPHYFRAFYSRRACRILPLYILLVVSFFSTAAYVDITRSQTLWLLLNSDFGTWVYSLFLQNFSMTFYKSFGPEWIGVTWSLAVEEQFYLLLPLLVWVVDPKRLPLWCGLLVMSAPLFRMIIVLFFHEHALGAFVLLPSRMDALLLGVLGAWALRQDNVRDWIRQHNFFLYTACGIATISMVGLALFSVPFLSILMSIFGYTWIALCYLLLVVTAVMTSNRFISGFLTVRPLMWIGRISFFVYLFHQLTLYLVHYWLTGSLPRHGIEWGLTPTAIALGIVIAAGTVSYFFLEKPFISHGRSVRYD